MQFGGSYVAHERGYYERYGLDVSLVPGGPGVSPDAAVAAGQALVGISAANFTGQSVADGAPVQDHRRGHAAQPVRHRLAGGQPHKRAPATLRGTKLGMAFNNQLDLELLTSLNGVDISQIEVITSDYDPAPLVNGEVDSLLCWLTDLPVAMTVKGIDNTTMLFADFGYTVHSQTYIVTEDSLANNRDTVLSLLRGDILGWQEYKSNTDAAAQLTVDRFPDAGMDLETQKVQASEQLKIMFSADTDANGFPVVHRRVHTGQHRDPGRARRGRDRRLVGPVPAGGDLRRRSGALVTGRPRSTCPSGTFRHR